jgi:serine/threonine protein kinase
MAAAGALPAEDARVCPEDFEIRNVLGKGGFGKVFLVCKADRDDLLAMKVMNKASIIEKDQIEHIQQERRVLQAVHHPFIISLEYAFHTPTDLFLVLEFCQGGDVYETMQARPRGSQHFNEKEARFIGAEITLALGHLHSQDIAFRDLKPENVLFDMEGHVRLTDFGLAKPSISTSLRETTCGTPLYMSPEGVQNHAHDSPKHPAGAGGWPGLAVDWWMLGVLMYELTLCDTPFTGSDMAQLMQSISRDDVSFKDNHGLSESCVDIIMQLLHKKPEHRLGGKSTDQVKDHEWFAGLDWERLLRKEIPPPYVPEPCTDEHGVDDPLKHFPQRMTEQPVTNADFSAPAGRQRQLDPDPFKDSDSGVNDFYYDRVEAQTAKPTSAAAPLTPMMGPGAAAQRPVSSRECEAQQQVLRRRARNALGTATH